MGWVTQIILFLLLALITDLLLPASSFRKYIKLVVGLLLILVFLQPVFQLFQIDMDRFFHEQRAWVEGEDSDSMENLIDSKKREIQASQGAYILEQMAVQLETEVEEKLAEQYEVAIQDLSFQMKEGEEVGLEALESVVVVLVPAEQQKERNAGEVEEVVINTESAPSREERQPSLTPIQTFLSSSWQIEEDRLQVHWEGGAG
ncbi:stage III sporulation protein AF [Pontibacillus halophilus]|uniref:stage III sporulation protein AF n=1 Tax=Pontibacillus halophilus TaxID=516704 RepID=UPI002277245C|nr:stage III sporulation protein AF [Pontibacillus halophilus]